MEHIRSRASDPSTSFEAAENSKNLAKLHYIKILTVMKEFGAMGKDGIAYLANLDANQVSRRLPEMAKEGWIELTGRVVKSKSGRSEREWRVLTVKPKQSQLDGL